jgi:protein phosphatase
MYKCIISCPLNQKPQIPFSSNHRYNLSNSSSENLVPYAVSGDRHFFELTVIDTKPGQQSILDSNLDQVDDFDRDSLVAVGIPDLAFNYLALAEYYPTVPELLDAWIDNQQQEIIIITPDDQNSSSFKDYLSNNQLEKSKIIALLQTIAKLWKSFSKINCCHTLLNLDNLKISSDGVLTIDKIYVDPETTTLKQLVETWDNLLSDIKGDWRSLISDLMSKIESESIRNIRQIRQHLQILAQEAELESILKEQEGAIELSELDIITEEDEIKTIAEHLDYDENSESSEETQINQELDDQPTVVLPMKLLSIKEAALTDIGRRRAHNEDCFAIEIDIHKQETSQGTNLKAKGLFIVCDGMGGHASGEVASSMAVKHLRDYFNEHWQDDLPDVQTIKEGILLTNEVLYSKNTQKGQTGSGRMGTTLVMTLLKNNKLAIAHVGDSRAYKLTRKKGLEKLTIDHCVAQTEIRQGVAPEIAYGRPDAFQLTQALGPRDNNFVHPEISFIDIKEDTLLLMCSDGLYDNDLLENNYQKLLQPLLSSNRDLEDGLVKIIDFANEVNGHDNITCLLVRIKVQPNLENQMTLFS